jgi:hypothetical protein
MAGSLSEGCARRGIVEEVGSVVAPDIVVDGGRGSIEEMD